MNEFYNYTIQMQKYLSTQNKRIENLESTVQSLLEQLEQLKTKPTVNVERIEYKFDQLKVETLEGTLNIGLNPNDLSNIEELAVPSSNPSTFEPYMFPARNELIHDIHNHILTNLDTLIKDTESELGFKVDPSYHEFIQNDLERQLQQRIEQYLDQTSPTERSPHLHEQIKQKIIEKLNTDIHIAVRNFIIASNKQPGGNSNHGV
ncbi:spore germination protein GerPC [Peribacillus huizhouensis]|uniref:Spore germination protein PC n=1 Tax=Peribacillus huizhouensis TaxID=1501239 RepID=A0ABR6CJS0_9BACI|nr:spore germination protein GerPC [Peribacillus huizhouensis]MBA9025232.1 spore germination protein PC [Peribacillus huizhouensis]